MKQSQADVGVLVARFQVHELHEGHLKLMNYVLSKHDKVIVFLGLSPVKVTIQNPLDFEARKQMVLQDFPNVNVLYIKDSNDDQVWSKKLDSQISDLIGPNSTVMLYGGRESFIDHYNGKWPTEEYEQEVYTSGTQVRKQISKSTMADPAFRAGVIWAANNQYPQLYPTVDIAIWNDDGTNLLVGKKKNEEGYRFIGGFSGATPDPCNCYEQNAIREVREETGVEIGDLKYIGSTVVDDWRYRRELDKIGTIFFESKRCFGKPTPMDDIDELRWFPWRDLYTQITKAHKPLLLMLLKRSGMKTEYQPVE